ncbi:MULTISPECIES: putative bifunctional diguanylate cyclase/phosphodiesterase [Shewanella]|uniref:EAL domain-containing protein n=1 Tax=bacterium 19NY03SH02 TaxID=2920631 RepID=A0AAU6V5I2_UNCXX|nr:MULTISPECIES: GGDEF domain-containing response regulator [Shewanella]MBO2563714.1 EAL domain-containing protein [Shewanella algae]MBO2585202.1 EAL domain-containing protein [Shewanella algae]MBO2699177.1 EAL domain-containing protein [Shewanella algae]MCE9775091.1 EAL domain-containing protein [Shewanella algae]MCT8979614.1 EAL domain-containing protein [Shewanella algae]
MNLLLIDDDEIDRAAIIRALDQSSLAFKVMEANCAQSGLEFACQQRFDGILLDYMLPDANGLEVLSRLNESAGEQTAVVMISRYEDDKLAQRCIELGAQDFLLKDEVNTSRLTRAIRNAKQRASMALALRQSHEKLKELAEHDSLTKLVNRYGFELCLNRTLSQVKRHQDMLAVILLDLDDFKGINDTLGHQVGDILLVEVANRLSAALREGDLIARLGGDEFVVLVTESENRYFPMAVANRLQRAFEEPFPLGEHDVLIGASIGIAVYSDSVCDSSELLKCADIAMYRAKKVGRNQIQFYSEELAREVRFRNRIEMGLRTALERDEFRVFYQGKFDAISGELLGMEALLRWQHPEDGLLAPDSFLPIAEEIGLVDEIGEWVLAQACAQTVEWLAMLAPVGKQLSVAVNLSPSQIIRETLYQTIVRVLQQTGLPASLLELELTENALIEEPLELAKVLERIAALGVVFSLDDFGTGFSSLEHIKYFPINVLKIDKSFVASVEQDERGKRLLSALINFANGFNVVSVAEGIETEAQAQFCRERGCNLLQGYLYCRPIQPQDFETQHILPLLAEGDV